MRFLLSFPGSLLLWTVPFVMSGVSAFQRSSPAFHQRNHHHSLEQASFSTSTMTKLTTTTLTTSHRGTKWMMMTPNDDDDNNNNNNNNPKKKKRKRQVYKHLFRNYEDISFDSWLRCLDPMEFLTSVGYTSEELEALLQLTGPSLLGLNVHDQLAPKLRFLVETLQGGTGHLTWGDDTTSSSSTSSTSLFGDDDEECSLATAADDDHDHHSMRLSDTTKQALMTRDAKFFFLEASLDRIMGPHHAYLQHHNLMHGPKLLFSSNHWQLFLSTCGNHKDNLLDFVELCNEWETQKNDVIIVHHSVESVQAFEQVFTPGLLPAVKGPTMVTSNHDSNNNNNNDDESEELIHRVPLMLRHGANPFEYDKQGVLPLHWAAGRGYLPAVEALLECYEMERRQGDDDSSSSSGGVIVDILDQTREPKMGATAFHWACAGMTTLQSGVGGSYDLCQWMLERAGERREDLATLPTWVGQSTPLMWAAWSGSVPIMDLLVIHGADPSYVNSKDETALHWAAAAGQLEVCQYLFESAATTTMDNKDPCQLFQQPDQTGQSPLDYAKIYNRVDIVTWMTDMMFSQQRQPLEDTSNNSKASDRVQ